MAKYNSLSKELIERITEDRINHVANPYAFKNEDAVRRNMNSDKNTILRPSFVRDIDKIMHIPFYNRYSDKTQVFSFVKNDDISRRALHVQFVSRIAKNIGAALGLNLDLIEAISLGHDIGHTPFGHAGERILSELYHERTGRLFNHNIHSARVLDKIFPLNISLQTLDGIICHNGETELQEYKPEPCNTFEELDARIEGTYIDSQANKKLVPATLEACVMRVSDIIAYLGKDRQDAMRLGILEDDSDFSNDKIGKSNAEIINNMIVNIVEKSYGKPYLSMDREFFEAFSKGKEENYKVIYKDKEHTAKYDEDINPMFAKVYEKLLKDLLSGDENTLIYKHHIEYINEQTRFYEYNRKFPYAENEPNDIVVDYMAGMTDDYFIDLYNYLFPESKHRIVYKGYFE